MDFFNQNTLPYDLGYTTYPNSQYLNNMTNYSNTNNVTYYPTNLRKETYGNRNDLVFQYEMSKKRENMSSSLEEALNAIKDSVMDELNDELFYAMLINQALEDEDKEIIRSIRDDEVKHGKILRDVYYSLTGITLPQAKKTNDVMPMSYIQNLKKAFFGEGEAIAKYRDIMNAMKDRKNYDDIMEIMVDEIRHMAKYNYLISKEMHNMEYNSTEPND